MITFFRHEKMLMDAGRSSSHYPLKRPDVAIRFSIRCERKDKDLLEKNGHDHL